MLLKELNEFQRKEFEENGFVIIKDIFNQHEVIGLLKAVEIIKEQIEDNINNLYLSQGH